MSVKLALLKSNEMVISDLKEVRSGNSLVAYVLHKPHKVTIQREFLLTEEQTPNSDGREVQVMMTPWVVLTCDEDIIVTHDWVASVMEPLESIKEMYEEKVNVQSNE